MRGDPGTLTVEGVVWSARRYAREAREAPRGRRRRALNASARYYWGLASALLLEALLQ